MGEINGGFEAIYRKYYDIVHRYICRAVHNCTMEADDLTQEVFWVAYQKWEILRVHPNVGGFLMVVAKNKVKKWLVRRSLVFYGEEEMLEALSDNAETTDEYAMVDLCSAVEKTLSHEELDILMQYYGFGYSVEEMSAKLGIKKSCFKVRVLRMREKLRRSIELAVVFFAFWGGFFGR